MGADALIWWVIWALAGSAPPDHPAPACPAIVLGNQVLVSGQPTGLSQDEPAAGVRRIRTWPYDDSSVLLAWETTWESPRRADPDGVLWLVSCKNPRDRREWLRMPGADLGSGGLDAARRQLYATGPRGVVAISLVNGATRQLTRAPALDDACWLDAEDGEADRQIDVVAGLSADGRTLHVERGAPCGFEGDWVAWPFDLTGLDDKEPTLEEPHPVAAVVADAAGELWVGDAGRCNEPGVRDRQSASVVWRSRDAGDSWESVEVVADGIRMHTAALVIAADAKQAGHLAVLSAVCRSSAATYGGRIFLTRDAGKSWQVAALPEGLTAATALALPGGGFDSLLVWGEGRGFTSGDGGKSWRSGPAGRPPELWTNALLGPLRFEAGAQGLVRTGPLLPPVRRVFPNGDVR